MTLLFIFSSTAYFSWRITVLNYNAPIFSIVFFIAELFGLIITYSTLFVTWKVRERKPEKPPSDLKVDIFITTYNESPNIIRLTTLAAKKIRYPHKTWILDDGNRVEIMDLAENLGCLYIGRKENTSAKAGNLNNALKHSKADFIALFDADHVPEENFLDELLGYFNDLEVAYVQAPQDFYNIDSFQFQNDRKRKLLWHDQMFFYQIGQAGRDYWNATTFCGTNSIIRRDALDKTNGFATETVTEDMHTAVRLQKAGYKSVYHPESLAYGVAASSYVEYLQQRLRWGHGNVQTLREENLPFCRGLTIPQKICYASLGLVYFEGWSRLILYFTPAIVLLTGIAPIGDTRLFFWFFIPYFLSVYFCIEEFGRGSTRFFVSEYMAMARFPVSLLATFGLIFKRKRFRITSKENSDHVPFYLIVPQLIIMIFNMSAFVVGIVSPPEILIFTMSGGTILVICFWAAINLILAASVIYSIIRFRERQDENRLRIQLPLQITNYKGQPIYAVINIISIDKMTFQGTIEQAPDVGEKIGCVIYLDKLNISVQATIDSIETKQDKDIYLVSCSFDWDSQKDRDLLNLRLHACSWHRRFTWDGGFSRTPLEWLMIFLNPSRWKEEFKRNKWQPVLINVCQEENILKFGLIMYTRFGNRIYINTSDKFDENQQISLINPAESGKYEKVVRIVNGQNAANKMVYNNAYSSDIQFAEIISG